MNSHHLWIFFSSCAATHHVSVAPTRPPSMETGKMMSFMSFLSCRRASWTAAPYRRRPPNSGNRPPGPLPPPSAVLLENNQSGGGKKNQKGEIRAYALSVNARSSLESIYNCTSTTNILIPHHIVFSRTRGYLTQIRRRRSKDVRRRHIRPRHPPSDEDPEHPHPPPSKSEHPPRARGPDPSRR